ANGSAGDSPAATTAAAAVKLAVELAAPARLGKTTLHPYRIAVKELRNVLQLATGGARHALVDDLGEVKDAIGEWHDWQELIEIAGKALRHGPRCPLMSEIRNTTERSFERALRRTERLRK